jgi:hypothetical protein
VTSPTTQCDLERHRPHRTIDANRGICSCPTTWSRLHLPTSHKSRPTRPFRSATSHTWCLHRIGGTTPIGQTKRNRVEYLRSRRVLSALRPRRKVCWEQSEGGGGGGEQERRWACLLRHLVTTRCVALNGWWVRVWAMRIQVKRRCYWSLLHQK